MRVLNAIIMSEATKSKMRIVAKIREQNKRKQREDNKQL
jgi:hypothetical protein